MWLLVPLLSSFTLYAIDINRIQRGESMSKVTIAIIEEVGGDIYILKCARCEGTGRAPSSWGGYSTKICNVCGGKGIVGVKIINGQPPFVVCARCEGTGREPSSWGGYKTEPCSACSGVGGQPISGKMEILK